MDYCGGQVLEQGDLARGCFCAPTVVADVPQEHSLWRQMFLPITKVTPVESLEQAIAMANDSPYGA